MENHLALFRAMDQESLATISMVDCDPGVQEKCFLYGAKMLAGTAQKKQRKEKVSF
jgi:hypothetical protein